MFNIIKDTVKSLRQPSDEVTLPLSKEYKDLLDEMLEYLKLSQDEEYQKKHKKVREGVGLAAPQVGLNKRMLVIYYTKDKSTVAYQLVNPKIISESVRMCYLPYGEGCLSVDKDHEGYVYRHFKIVVEAFDALQNQNITITARGFDAVVLQHEIDHLNGILFYDHIDKNNPYKKIESALEL